MAYTRLSDANVINEKYMDSILFEERLIDSVAADVSAEFLGERFSMHVFNPPFHISAGSAAASSRDWRNIP